MYQISQNGYHLGNSTDKNTHKWIKKSFTAKDLTTFTKRLNMHKFKLKSSITSKHFSYHIHFIIKQTSDDVHLNQTRENQDCDVNKRPHVYPRKAMG